MSFRKEGIGLVSSSNTALQHTPHFRLNEHIMNSVHEWSLRQISMGKNVRALKSVPMLLEAILHAALTQRGNISLMHFCY